MFWIWTVCIVVVLIGLALLWSTLPTRAETPSQALRDQHAAEMAARSLNGLDGVHGPPR